MNPKPKQIFKALLFTALILIVLSFLPVLPHSATSQNLFEMPQVQTSMASTLKATHVVKVSAQAAAYPVNSTRASSLLIFSTAAASLNDFINFDEKQLPVLVANPKLMTAPQAKNSKNVKKLAAPFNSHSNLHLPTRISAMAGVLGLALGALSSHLIFAKGKKMKNKARNNRR